MFDGIFAFFEAQAFSIFMIGWITTLVGAVAHMIGGGFRDGASKVPVLGNWKAIEEGEQGFVQQKIAIVILRIGLVMVLVGGLVHFL